MALLMVGADLKGVPVGIMPPLPTGTALPTVLVAIMGPLPMAYGGQGRTTLDDTLAMCAAYGPSAVPIFIPGFITEDEDFSDKPRSRLRGMTAMRNWGVRAAIDYGYDYLLLIENDVEVQPATLERLLRHDKDILLPRLTYPIFDPIEELCYGPHDRPAIDGLLRLTWAAHCCILFKVEALKRIEPPVWRGFQGEGEDHEFWQQQKCYAHMDMDTPVKVLQLARGHKDFYEIPFRAHTNKGVYCPGPVYLSTKSRDVGIYLCKAEGCAYEMVTMKPKTIRSEEMDSVELMVEMAKLREHWAARAPYYPKLEWAKDKGYIKAVVDAADLARDDYVLDAGTGPGYIAREAARKAHHVIGLDVSPEMMAHVNGRKPSNLEFIEGDIRAIPYPRGRFDKVFARMVIHGLDSTNQLSDAYKAIRECYRILAPGGKFIFSEGIPVTRGVRKWYAAMFALKEKRLVMDTPRMRRMMTVAGFKDITVSLYMMPRFSVANWLANSALSPEQQAKIMDVHRNMPKEISKPYRAIVTEGDVLIRSMFATLVGTK